MKLIIVESPAKCDTIKRYLGKDYLVMASLGHIRDLATSGKDGLGVDVEDNFKPKYIINKGKYKTVKQLQDIAKKCDEVILATDPDREGEAIAWHLAQVLGLDVKTNKRLEFHEITRDSITNAINNPRTIDLDLVASQETRRILDRIIGFKLSALLKKKIKSQSAGRVQSATLKIIYDHEKEINAFVPEEYWKINVKSLFNDKEFSLEVRDDKGKEIKISNKEEADKLLARIPDTVKVINVSSTVRKIESKPPFTTSTLQQAAFNKFKYKTKKTQFIAQELYEGMNIGEEHVGLITYMRTDSTRLSPTFIARAMNYIKETFGEQYIGHIKKTKESETMQDAHEAIRPTGNHRTPESLKAYLTSDQYNLYKLIYDRAVASLMAPKKEEVTSITLEGNGLIFKLEGVRTIFNGYEALYKEESKSTNKLLPLIKSGDIFKIISKDGEQKFTQPPARYSEAKIVKIMEEVGIGRPSTYASTIGILQQRKYVSNSGGILAMTEQGNVTAGVLGKYFPNIVNAEYTANMETQLDNIQEGNDTKIKILEGFYKPFIEQIEDATKKMYVQPPKPTGKLCPKCGSPLVYKEGKNGQFIGCSNFPRCKYVEKEEKPQPVKTGELCPKCGSPLVERKDRRGKVFIACSAYPKCHYIKSSATPSEVVEPEKVKKCPECGGWLVKKKGKYGYFLGCNNYPKCHYMEKISKKGK